ncbi:MAG: hypothetical protein J5527_06585 [Treponema sp.]|nr:hypothetical protein [Treponema sp.]
MVVKREIVYFIFFFILLLLFINCKHNQNQNNDLQIVSPKANWIYDDNTDILFSANIDDSELEWISSIDGTIGYGPQILIKLSEGRHFITLLQKSTETSRMISINVNMSMKKSFSTRLLTCLPVTINEKSENALFSLNGSIKNINICYSKETNEEYGNNLLMDKVIKANENKKKIHSSRNQNLLTNLSQERSFFVVNTKNQVEAAVVKANLVHKGEYVSVYVDESVNDYNLITDCIKNVEKTIFPRVTNIWGSWDDIDKDGKITLLFTSTINEESVAIGFFNQNDFYKNEIDLKSKSYNPYSNEMDILYIAVPEIENKSYSVSSICATIAHEFAHLINYSFRDNELDVFLDEGLSHLTESLVGFGVSGGNMDFVNYFLSNSNAFSFNGKDLYGETDSVGIRGAITLFLYYLINQKWKLEWDEDYFLLKDNGEISYLRRIANSKEDAWLSIGSEYGVPTDVLFKQFCNTLFNNRISEILDFSKVDPLTLEPIFICNELSCCDCNEIHSILPYSFTKFENIYDYEYYITGDSIIGNIYLLQYTDNSKYMN